MVKKRKTGTMSSQAKMTVAQLTEIVEKQNEMISQLNEKVILLENKVNRLEGQVCINKSIQFVSDRVYDELKQQLTDLQQYSRRNCAIIAGVEKRSTNLKRR